MFSSPVFLLTVPRRCLFCGPFLLLVFRVCLSGAVFTAHNSLVLTCWEKSDLLALWYMMFSCVLSLFPCGVLGQVWFLIVSIPDLCLLHYFNLEVINEFLFP